MPDTDYLDGYDPGLLEKWLVGNREDLGLRELLERRLSQLQVKDDFVEIRLPRLASAAPNDPAVGDAVREYEKQAAVVDTRLFRKVSLRLKHTPLVEFCEALQKQTGVRLQPSRAVSDENVTVFVKEKPAREVMRAVARLFGYEWSRSGEAGSYKYELYQDLRSQLAEEEMRNRDLHEALAQIDEEMAGYRPYLEQSPQQLKERLERLEERSMRSGGKVNPADAAEIRRLKTLTGPAFGPIQVYHRLSPPQLQALAVGNSLQFSTNAASPDLRLPAEWRLPLLELSRLQLASIGGTPVIDEGFGADPGPPLTQVPGAEASVFLSVERAELGQLTLRGGIGASVPNGPALTGAARTHVRMMGTSPSVAVPDNAALNAKLRGTPPFLQVVSFHPKPSCPWFGPEAETLGKNGFRPVVGGRESYRAPDGSLKLGKEPPHVSRADAWEAVHEAAGLPIITDAYTRLFTAKELSIEKAALFDALCQTSDRMKQRWHKDGDFLLARTTSYFWDKVKEVPARHLHRWRGDRQKQGSLPLEALLEMASLSDAQLTSRVVGHAVGHCWGLEEWGLVGASGAFEPGLPTGHGQMRRKARFLAMLNPAQLAQARQHGLAFEHLAPVQREALIRLLDGGNQESLQTLQFRVEYIPAGSFVWRPHVSTSADADEGNRKWPVVWGKTREETLAAARRHQPMADDAVRCSGLLVLHFVNPKFNSSWKVGAPGISISRQQ